MDFSGSSSWPCMAYFVSLLRLDLRAGLLRARWPSAVWPFARGVEPSDGDLRM